MPLIMFPDQLLRFENVVGVHSGLFVERPIFAVLMVDNKALAIIGLLEV